MNDTPAIAPIASVPEIPIRPFRRFLGNGNHDWKCNSRDLVVMLILFPVLVGFYFLAGVEFNHIVSAPDGDIAYYWLWARSFLGAALREHRIPFWNPYIMSGTPFLASNQAAVFYPPNWLFAVLPVGTLLNIQIVLHFWLALAAMYWLARRIGRSEPAALIGALVFAFSGFAILHSWQGHLPFVTEMPWTPLVVLGWVQMQDGRGLRGMLLLSAALAMQFFSGHPQIVYFTLAIVALLQVGWLAYAIRSGGAIAAWRGTAWLVCAVVAAGLLFAAQALPTAMYASQTVRAAAVPAVEMKDYIETQSQPISNLITIVAPWAWGGRPGKTPYIGTEGYWEVTGYIGAIAFLLTLALVVRWKMARPLDWTCIAILLFAGLLSLGRFGYLYNALLHLLPGLSMFRNPGRWLYVVTFAFAMLATAGLDRLSTFAQERAVEFWLVLKRLSISVGALAVLFLVIFADGVRGPFFIRWISVLNPNIPENQISRENLGPIFSQFKSNILLALLFGGAACAVFPLLASFAYRRFVEWGIALLVAAELLYFAVPYAQSFWPKRHEWPEAISTALQQSGHNFRMASAREPGDLNQGMASGVRHIWGYEPTVSYRYASAMAVSQGIKAGFPAAWMSTPATSPLTNALGARYLVGPLGLRPTDTAWEYRTRSGDWLLFENKLALPRAFTVAAAQETTDPVTTVNAKDFAPTQTVLLEEPAPSGFADTSQTTAPGTAQITVDLPERIDIDVDLHKPGWLVLMDQMLPGWTAEVDGKPSHIYRANAVGRAIPLLGGKHRVLMSYHAPGFAVGRLISGIAWILWSFIAVAVALKCAFSRRTAHKSEA